MIESVASTNVLSCERCGYEWLPGRPQHASHDCVEYLRGLYWDAVEYNRSNRWWCEIDVDLSSGGVDEQGFQTFNVGIYDSLNRSGFPNKKIRVTALGADEARKLVQHELFRAVGRIPDEICRGGSGEAS